MWSKTNAYQSLITSNSNCTTRRFTRRGWQRCCRKQVLKLKASNSQIPFPLNRIWQLTRCEFSTIILRGSLVICDIWSCQFHILLDLHARYVIIEANHLFFSSEIWFLIGNWGRLWTANREKASEEKLVIGSDKNHAAPLKAKFLK